MSARNYLHCAHVSPSLLSGLIIRRDCRLLAILEPENRSRSNTKVIVSSTVEVYFVTRFKTQPERSEERFEPAARIKCDVRARSSHAIHCTGKRAGIVGAEVNEADLAGNEGAEWSRGAELQLGAKQPVNGRTPVVTNVDVPPVL